MVKFIRHTRLNEAGWFKNPEQAKKERERQLTGADRLAANATKTIRDSIVPVATRLAEMAIKNQQGYYSEAPKQGDDGNEFIYHIELLVSATGYEGKLSWYKREFLNYMTVKTVPDTDEQTITINVEFSFHWNEKESDTRYKLELAELGRYPIPSFNIDAVNKFFNDEIKKELDDYTHNHHNDVASIMDILKHYTFVLGEISFFNGQNNVTINAESRNLSSSLYQSRDKAKYYYDTVVDQFLKFFKFNCNHLSLNFSDAIHLHSHKYLNSDRVINSYFPLSIEKYLTLDAIEDYTDIDFKYFEQNLITGNYRLSSLDLATPELMMRDNARKMYLEEFLPTQISVYYQRSFKYEIVNNKVVKYSFAMMNDDHAIEDKRYGYVSRLGNSFVVEISRSTMYFTVNQQTGKLRFNSVDIYHQTSKETFQNVTKYAEGLQSDAVEKFISIGEYVYNVIKRLK